MYACNMCLNLFLCVCVCRVVEPGIPTSPVAGRKQLLSFHSRDYVQFLETHSNEEEFEMEEAEGFGLGR